jgi:hypothetical protein
MGRRSCKLQCCRDRSVGTHHMGLRLAVMALRVEATLVLASGRGGLEVGGNRAGRHCVYLLE